MKISEPTLFHVGWERLITEPTLFHAGCKDTIMPVNDYPLCHTLLCSLSPELSLSIITSSCEGPYQACLKLPKLHPGQRLGQHICDLLICGNVLELHISLLHHITDILYLSSTEHHTRLLPATPRNHWWPQTDATSWGALLVSYTTGPIWICIANQSELAICNISEAIINHTFQVPEHMLCRNQVNLSQINHILTQSVPRKAYI